MAKFLLNFLVFLFLSFSFTSGQTKNIVVVQAYLKTTDPEPHLILYQTSPNLQIQNFKGKPDTNSPGVAATYSGLKMEMASTQRGNEIKVEVGLTCYFDPSKSWMKKSGKNIWVLNHEQKHFDLTYIQTCKLLNAIREYSFTKNWHRELMSLRQKYMDELTALQNRYDKETKHGTNRNVQQEFNETIEKELTQISCR